jgi:hypothetical protein
MQQANDLKAFFSAHIEENRHSLYTLALRLTGNAADAEDSEQVAHLLTQQPDEFLNWWANPEKNSPMPCWQKTW